VKSCRNDDYTPEASNSPAMQALSEKNLTPLRHDDGVDLETRAESERLPALQTVISA